MARLRSLSPKSTTPERVNRSALLEKITSSKVYDDLVILVACLIRHSSSYISSSSLRILPSLFSGLRLSKFLSPVTMVVCFCEVIHEKRLFHSSSRTEK